MKNLVQWILLLGGLYFLYKRFVEEKKSGALGTPAIQKKTKTVMLD